jgi:5-formyltetrahydrofolate cyclo-ligase
MSPLPNVIPRSDSPAALRRWLRAQRRSLSGSQQRNHAQALRRRLGRHPAFLGARRVGIYWPADGEIDPRPLLDLARARRKRWHLPVLCPHPHPRLWFLTFRPDEPMRPNRFGIPEPTRRNRRLRVALTLDLLLVPLVGFDAECHRLGMGGGYYDRTLSYLSHRDHWRRPRLIGLAHECQRVAALPVRPWDIPLDFVVTEREVYRRRPTA